MLTAKNHQLCKEASIDVEEKRLFNCSSSLKDSFHETDSEDLMMAMTRRAAETTGSSTECAGSWTPETQSHNTSQQVSPPEQRKMTNYMVSSILEEGGSSGEEDWGGAMVECLDLSPAAGQQEGRRQKRKQTSPQHVMGKKRKDDHEEVINEEEHRDRGAWAYAKDLSRLLTEADLKDMSSQLKDQLTAVIDDTIQKTIHRIREVIRLAVAVKEQLPPPAFSSHRPPPPSPLRKPFPPPFQPPPRHPLPLRAGNNQHAFYPPPRFLEEEVLRHFHPPHFPACLPPPPLPIFPPFHGGGHFLPRTTAASVGSHHPLFKTTLNSNSHNNSHNSKEEQTEALPLVVANNHPSVPPAPPSSSITGAPHKRKRTKVTDTRLSPRGSSRADAHQHRGSPLDALHSALAPLHHNPHHLPVGAAGYHHAADIFPFDAERASNGDRLSPGYRDSSLSRGSPGRDSLHMTDVFDSMEDISQTSTLTPVHLRKAKLMFFYTRYPSSSILKAFFPDVRFNKNNTAQLVKWFSNFREFYYIQMEKYARMAITEGIKDSDDIHITVESEIFRVLNLHYNRNNQIDVPDHFRLVVEATLREFFNALSTAKDHEQSWKKPIYKVIARMDQTVPEFFKSLNWVEQLVDN